MNKINNLLQNQHNKHKKIAFTLNCISRGFRAEAQTAHNECVRANAK